MEIYKGKTGLKETWQEEFNETEKCDKCGGNAEIMFVAIEKERKDKEKTFICELKKTTGKKGGLWLHDACAVAVYLCQDCFEPKAIVNQG